MRITEKGFLDQAETGDILLFRSKSLGNKLLRTMTRSEFDHIALLLKYTNGKIILFEATGKEGVGLSTWSTFRKNKWDKLY